MRTRQKMQTFDWFSFAALVAVGVFLGLVIGGLFALAAIGAWGSILMIIALSAGFIVFYLILERVFEFISTGRFSAPRQLQKPRKPLVMVFGLPLGIIIGIIGAQFGLGDLLL
jgi:hypothetical protein